MKWTIILAGLILMYLLYSNGYLILQSKRAAVFTGDGKGRKNRLGFSFTKCSGWASRVLKVKEDGLYRFDLDAQLSAGTVQFQLLNGNKEPLLTLTPETCRGRVQLEKNQRCFVKFQFIHTSGSCAAGWEKE